MKTLSTYKEFILTEYGSLCTAVFFFLMLSSCGPEANKEGATKPTTKQQASVNQNFTTVTMPIEGMSCGSCVSNVKKTVKALEGVQAVAVSLEKRQATITYAPETISAEQISKAIDEKGYKTGQAVVENK